MEQAFKSTVTLGDNLIFSYDIALLSLPKLDPTAPLIAPAILKAQLTKQSFSSKCFDLNLEFYLFVSEGEKEYWREDSLAFHDYGHFESLLKSRTEVFIDQWLEHCFETHQFRYIGISAITYHDRYFCNILLEKLNKLKEKRQLEFPKVVIGGSHTSPRFQTYLASGIVDHVVLGDGEENLIALLKGEILDPIIGKQGLQVENLDEFPTPDYSDFNLDRYPKDPFNFIFKKEKMGLDTKLLYVTGSRGCVRNCDFCDIGYYWKKYRNKSPRKIFEELKTLNSELGVNHFYFTDSLINADPRALKELCLLIISNELKIRFRGQFNITDKVAKDLELFELLGRAGCETLIVGVESGSEDIRRKMGKPFTNSALFDCLELCKNNNISMALLMMSGYPEESQEDFDMTLSLLEKLGPYQDQIEFISPGYSAMIFNDTPLEKKMDELGIIVDSLGFWRTATNTISIRYNRFIQLQSKIEELNFDERVPHTSIIRRFEDLIMKSEKLDQLLGCDSIHKTSHKVHNQKLLKSNNFDSMEKLQFFMSRHVWCVWDFMNLIKHIQMKLSFSNKAWHPPVSGSSQDTLLINEIMLEEESDIIQSKDRSSHPVAMSHVELYLKACDEMGISLECFHLFLDHIRNSDGTQTSYEMAAEVGAPAECVEFLKATHQILATNSIESMVAALVYGRENIIPKMFSEILEQLALPLEKTFYFRTYLNRHIHVDLDRHAPMAMQLLINLLEKNPGAIEAARQNAICSLEARSQFFQSIFDSLPAPASNSFPVSRPRLKSI